VRSRLLGRHNALNTTAAIGAAVDVGVPLADAVLAVESFSGIKRRLEVIGVVNEVTVYDDFAHHPTAIRATLEALRQAGGAARIICILEPRSNTMRLGIHAPLLAGALESADATYVFADPSLAWDPHLVLDTLGDKCRICTTIDEIIDAVVPLTLRGDQIVIMSNGGFANIHARLLEALE
jgi:UDP-N-acetylmuramate: L-alanyl-gamma-D-glutamyl-meso-diaminopimelate ligase